MKKLIAATIALALSAQAIPAFAAGQDDDTAEEENGLTLSIIPRLDFSKMQWKYGEETTNKFNSSSLGNTMLYTILDGNITDNLSIYACFHLLDKETGWLYHNTFRSDECSWLDMFSLTYSLGNFDISLGKENLAFGGFEQDADICYPYLDLCSSSWHSIQSFLWGGRLGYNLDDDNNVFLQCVASPMSEYPFQDKLFCATLGWNGAVGNDETMWSFGVMRTGDEYKEYRNLWMLSLGDRYTAGDFTATFDINFRAFNPVTLFQEEMTSLLELRYSFNIFDVFAKGGWEASRADSFNYFGTTEINGGWNVPGTIVPQFIWSGRDYIFGGLGIECYPLADRSLRLHLVGAVNNYANDIFELGRIIADAPQYSGVKFGPALSINAGITYTFDVNLK